MKNHKPTWHIIIKIGQVEPPDLQAVIHQAQSTHLRQGASPHLGPAGKITGRPRVSSAAGQLVEPPPRELGTDLGVKRFKLGSQALCSFHIDPWGVRCGALCTAFHFDLPSAA